MKKLLFVANHPGFNPLDQGNSNQIVWMYPYKIQWRKVSIP